MPRRKTVEVAPPTGPALTLDPPVAYSGDEVAIAGVRFGARLAVRVSIDRLPSDRVRATRGGSFERGLVVPADWLPGTHLIQARSRDGGAETLLTVRNRIPVR